MEHAGTPATVLERMDDAIFALDRSWRFTYLNDRAEELLEVEASALLGEVVWDEFPEAVESTFQAEYERAIETQEPVSFEEYYPPLETWFQVDAFPSETGLSIRFRDVTDRVERERELERYERLVDAVQDGLYTVDPDGYFQDVNESYAALVGYEPEDLIGAHVSTVVDESARAEALDLQRGLLSGEASTASMTATLERADGSPVEVEGTFTRTPDGHRVGVVHDVSAQRRFERRLLALHEATRELFEAGSPEQVATVMTEALAEVDEVEAAAYYRLAPEADALERAAVVNQDGTLDLLRSVPLDEWCPALREPLESGETQHHTNLRSATDQPGVLARTGARSAIVAPVGDGGLLVVAAASPDAFADRTDQLVDIVAATAGVATDRLDYERTLQHQNERLDALTEIDALIHGLAESMFERSTRREIERLVCERLADSDSYEFAWIGTAVDGTVEVATGAGGEGYLSELSLSLAEPPDARGPTAQAHLTGEPQVVRDTESDPTFEPWREQARERGVRSSMAIPLPTGAGEPSRTLNLYSARPDAFDAEERDALTRLGAITGHAFAAVERAEELQRERNRLEFLNRLLRHNLLNSLNVVEARLEFLDGRVDYEGRDHLSTARDRVDGMITFVETVRRLTEVVGEEDAGQTLEPVDLETVLTDAVERSSAAYPASTYELGSLPTVDVRADDLLGQAFDNVLENAAQHNPAREPMVWVDASLTDDGERVVVSIADDGPGIPDERKERLFDGGPSAFADPARGFGLYLVDEVLDSYGGGVEVGDSEHGGAVFRLTFERA